MRGHVRRAVGGVALAVVLLGGCGDDDAGTDDRTTTTTTTGTGIANPASVFCEEQGGTVEIERDADGGERGICVLPDGTRVDEWEYFREHG